MPNDFGSFNFAKRAKINKIAKFKLAKINLIKVCSGKQNNCLQFCNPPPECPQFRLIWGSAEKSNSCFKFYHKSVIFQRNRETCSNILSELSTHLPNAVKKQQP